VEQQTQQAPIVVALVVRLHLQPVQVAHSLTVLAAAQVAQVEP
jgi:hypothetical protein